ncbi:MAG: hypothetical protein OEQ90_02735 [Gammaproteobacteria bacterium]|nr:hypothetical protein [Gammaproteobacteria bacterium]
MAKRNFALLMLASIGALALTNSVRAQEAFTGVDGCAVLAQLVYAEVTAAAWRSPSGIRPLIDLPGETKVTICNRTTRTVSKAFASAMTSVGAEVRWGYPSDDRGDYCLSGFLDQCYPDRNRLGLSVNAWSAVSKTVQRAMPQGVASDQSLFGEDVMRLALRSALGRRYSEY